VNSGKLASGLSIQAFASCVAAIGFSFLFVAVATPLLTFHFRVLTIEQLFSCSVTASGFFDAPQRQKFPFGVFCQLM